MDDDDEGIDNDTAHLPAAAAIGRERDAMRPSGKPWVLTQQPRGLLPCPVQYDQVPPSTTAALLLALVPRLVLRILCRPLRLAPLARALHSHRPRLHIRCLAFAPLARALRHCDGRRLRPAGS